MPVSSFFDAYFKWPHYWQQLHLWNIQFFYVEMSHSLALRACIHITASSSSDSLPYLSSTIEAPSQSDLLDNWWPVNQSYRLFFSVLQPNRFLTSFRDSSLWALSLSSLLRPFTNIAAAFWKFPSIWRSIYKYGQLVWMTSPANCTGAWKCPSFIGDNKNHCQGSQCPANDDAHVLDLIAFWNGLRPIILG